MPTKPHPHITLSRSDAQRLWCFLQRLGGHNAPHPADAVKSGGWLRTLGGIDAYLAILARVNGFQIEDLHILMKTGSLRVSPAARGCIYLVCESDHALALRLADILTHTRHNREVTLIGISTDELQEIQSAVLEILRTQTISTAALRDTLPKNFIRSLGAAGKKVGITSPLPIALRRLEFLGLVERTFEQGRIDTEKYLWKRRESSIFDQFPVPQTSPAIYAKVADHFFSNHGPATTDQFSAWSGIGKRAAQTAIDTIGAIPINVEGLSSLAYLAPNHEHLRDNVPEIDDSLSFLAFEDNYVTIHGGPANVTDSRHHHEMIGVWGRTAQTTIGDARHVSQRTVVHRGQIIGLWEFDIDSATVVWVLFDPPAFPLKSQIATRASQLGVFISQKLGHARSFSLDRDVDVRSRSAHITERMSNTTRKWSGE